MFSFLMPEEFFTNTDAIKQVIKSFLQEQDRFSAISFYGKDVLTRLDGFIPKGKLLRSNLCLKTAELLGHSSISSITPLAASLEFFHSSLLIHDDIIDQDILRRGVDSIPEQYRKLYPSQPLLLSQSLAICAGDIGFFFAFDLITKSAIPAEQKISLTQFIAKEMAYVGQAEMVDTALGYLPETPTIEDIMSVYQYKTARYTFSLPMMVGAIAANAEQETIDSLEAIGESLGILFQIKDDEIGLLGDEKTIGKDVGSDIAANKKTIFYYFLFEKASKKDAISLASLFGKQDLTKEDVQFVRDCLKTYEVAKDVQDLVHKEAEKARKLIAELSQSQLQELLTWFVDYNLSRSY